jgi:hypothetical protein
VKVKLLCYLGRPKGQTKDAIPVDGLHFTTYYMCTFSLTSTHH